MCFIYFVENFAHKSWCWLLMFSFHAKRKYIVRTGRRAKMKGDDGKIKFHHIRFNMRLILRYFFFFLCIFYKYFFIASLRWMLPSFIDVLISSDSFLLNDNFLFILLFYFAYFVKFKVLILWFYGFFLQINLFSAFFFFSCFALYFWSVPPMLKQEKNVFVLRKRETENLLSQPKVIKCECR